MEENVEYNFGNNFIINNDQGLEEEELEDRKRREEEIHKLLTHALGNCSLTDDSSVNSSSHTAVETTSEAPVLLKDESEKQYLESNIDDQLKVLYEIRCREVKELSEDLQKIKKELQDQQQITKTKLALLELENERKNVSLQEAQNLLVDKTEQINEMNKQLDNMKYMVSCLEGNLSEVNEEKEIMRQLNLSLEQQIHLMEKNGFPLMNKSSDRELRESLNIKIKQLEQSLESALKQNEHREKQHSELVQTLNQTIQEKENHLAEKNFLINKLTHNFETAQSQCQELIRTVSELREAQSNKPDCINTKSALDIELRKVREDRERSEMLESVKQSVTEEFQTQIKALTTENTVLNERLHIQEKQLHDALQRAEIISIIEKEKGLLQNKLHDLEEKLQYTINENIQLKERCAELTDIHSQNADISLQTSFPQINTTDLENVKQDNKKMFKKIESAQMYIHELETKIAQLQDEYSLLKIQADLEQERDALIKELKQKAVNFEKIIMEKQENYLKQHSEKTSIGINTDKNNEVDQSLSQIKYDALLYQKEADLRKELQKEFDAKCNELVAKSKLQTLECKDCERFKVLIQEINEERKQDRMAVVKLVEVWQNKIQEFGIDSGNKNSKIDQEYSERFKLLVRMLQEQFLKELKQQELKQSVNDERVNKINESVKKIIAKLKQSDKEVLQIRKQFKQKMDIQVKS